MINHFQKSIFSQYVSHITLELQVDDKLITLKAKKMKRLKDRRPSRLLENQFTIHEDV